MRFWMAAWLFAAAPVLAQAPAPTVPAPAPAPAPAIPAAPVFLLHGAGDTVIPTSESVLLGDYLRQKGADVHVLLSGLITHAEVDHSAASSVVWKLVSFWADVLRR